MTETSERKTTTKPELVLQRKTNDTPDKDNATGTRNSRDHTNKKRTPLNVENSFGAQNSEVDDSAMKQFVKQSVSKRNSVLSGPHLM